ncbi:MAG TPA: peptidylprolyl isomerase [Polyangiaceae bacterium]|nr:peptidylprolyl isomerase [Polyangiaceae bacterium]
MAGSVGFRRAHRRRQLAACGILLGTLVLGGCKKKQDAQPSPSASASQKPRALSPELAAKVLAKVGDRTITLGEYAATLERMDPFERLRYQSPDRRKQLLDEMIEVELLAQEARRRGLDQLPETQERLRQLLRDQLLEELKQGLPNPADLPEAEVRAYYDQHKEEFNEPERRRVAAIVLSSEGEAKRVLAQARDATAESWGKLVEQHGKARKLRPGPPPPTELAGDLGIVGPPADARSSNPRVPEAIREAVFKVGKIGQTYPELVSDGGEFYIVRLTGLTDARARSYQEAERAIRVAVVQARIREREAGLEKELRVKFPVKLDDGALSKLSVPSATPAASAKRGP